MPMERNADDLPPIPEIRCIGVIGAGQMGTGIAEVVALAGMDVHLLDISQERLEQAFERIAMHLRRRVARGARASAIASSWSKRPRRTMRSSATS